MAPRLVTGPTRSVDIVCLWSTLMLTVEHLCKAGLDADTANDAKAAGLSFTAIFALLMEYGPKAVDLIKAMIAAWQAQATKPLMAATKCHAELEAQCVKICESL